ncbi:hypothetical protein [Sphingomonas montanisoli]|uniref:Uncharacterized protein n=1 Tax=Sphingomonas montanisoli TaxID=2606412 RepID=A0A5D9CD72_9SPHN|nr:hypothetical protein [Sphingomonas montanisoli]TZG29102.1 hypothetical protein FYJ91_02900 [Sphingomonas montanisoli]
MLTLLSGAMFSAILIFSVATIVAGVKSELPLFLRAFGIEPKPAVPSLRPGAERRVRIIREAKLTPRAAMRAAA